MKKYLITDPQHYTTNPKSFSDALNRSLIKYTPDFVCFRDKTKGDKKELLEAFAQIALKTSSKSFVNGSLEAALQYDFDGVHLRSDQQDLITKAKDLDLLVIVSCHSEQEATLALTLGCDFVTLSPIFDTPNKGVAIGVEAFANMLKSIDAKKVFALGGIDNDEKAAEIEKLGVFGFASIRYFVT